MKSINYFIAIISISILNPINLYSQSNFETGYVIDIQKDTIKGFIDYRNWNITPKEIVFKTVPDSKSTIYTPTDILSFNVAGERYVSGIVTIDEGPFRDNELTESEMPQYRTDTVFLQVLIDGNKSLYSLKDNNLKVHYFIGQNGAFNTLFFKKYLQNVSGATFIKTNEKFKGQLMVYFQDCPSIQKKISYINYNQNDLINLFNEYYNCTQNTILYKSKLKLIKFTSEAGFFAGLSLTKLNFEGDDFFLPLTGVDFPRSANFSFGGFYNIVLPGKQGRLSIDNELMFMSYKTSGHYRDDNNIDIYTTSYSSFGYSYIKLNNLLKYKFPVNRIFLFADGGISNGIFISQTNYMRVETHIYSVYHLSEHEAVGYPRKWERGVLLGLGCNIKKYSCEFRFERADGMSDATGLTSQTIGYFIIFGYKF
jgi:hypothetical protein